MPWAKSSPLIRLTCSTRSAVRVLRSRQIRRRSSSCGVGARTMAHTRGSPRLYASNARTRASPSILSVFARRRRRDVAIEAGSTTWLSKPSSCSKRWIQKPSNRACHLHTTGFDLPDRRIISVVPKPSAVARMMLARHTCFCGALRSAMIASRRRRSMDAADPARSD